MSNPLDYEARQQREARKEEEAEAASRRQRDQILQEHLASRKQQTPRSAFESRLLLSRDLAAVAVIEAALVERGVSVRRVAAGVIGEVELCVPTRDCKAAQLLAAEIFARRKRIAVAAPRRKPEEGPGETHTPRHMPDFGGYY